MPERISYWYLGAITCLFFLSCFPSLAQTPSSGEGDLRPEVVIPFMQIAPKIDGVINPGEWSTLHISRLVQTEGWLQPRHAEFWLGSDGKKIYVAMKSAVHPVAGVLGDTRPERYRQDAGRVFGGIFGYVGGEDYLDIIIDNNPGEKTGSYFRIATNPNSGVYDTAYDHRVNISSPAFHADMQQAHSVRNGIWTAEIAIDAKSLGIADLRKLLAIRINRKFNAPGDYARWENPAAYSSDFPGTIELPETAPRVRFTDTAPIVNEVSFQDEQGINLALEVTNPTTKPLPLQVNVSYRQDKVGQLNQAQQVTLQPGETKRFTDQQPFAKADNYTAYGQMQVLGVDGTLFYQRNVNWKTRLEAKWDEAKPAAPAPAVEFQISFYPSYKILRWRTDFHRKDNAAEIKAARLVVVDTKTMKQIALKVVTKLPSSATEQQLSLKKLLPGRYEARLFLDGASASTTAIATQIFDYQTDFPWLKNKLGMSDVVIPPFTPLTVRGKTVGAVLRQHEMTETGLWGQIHTVGKDILTAPMRFEVKQQGKMQPVKARLRFIEKKATRVVAVSDWTAGALRGRTTSDYDYDGGMKVTLALSQHGSINTESLDLVIPLDNAQAPLMHEMSDMIRVNYGGVVPAGDGTVWTSKEAARGNLLGTFLPYIWVGGAERGLCWFASNDRDWVLDPTDQTAALALERHNGTLSLRVRFIQHPTKLTSTHTIVFGLQATPVKPMPENPNWRTWGMESGSKYDMITLGMCMYWGCPYYAVVPLNGEYEILRKIAQAKKQGIRDDAYFADLVKRIPQFRAELNYSSNPQHAAALLPYTNLFGADSQEREWVIYQDEWVHFNFNPGGRQTKFYDKVPAEGGWTDFCVLLVQSRQDYLVYCYKKILENGFDGIYWDNDFISFNPSPITGKGYRRGPDTIPPIEINPNAAGPGYVRDEGNYQPDTDIWELRALAKRTAVLCYEMGKPNRIISHMTNGNVIPVFSWVSMNLDWEWHYGASDFQDRFQRDYTLAATIGRQAGTRPVILRGIIDAKDQAWTERTQIAMMLPYELTVWQGFDFTRKVNGLFDAQGYGTDACKVYHSWDEKPVAHLAQLDGEYLLLENKDQVLLAISDFGDGGPAQITLDVKALGLPANFVAANWEKSTEQVTAVDGVLTLPAFKKHDFRILIIQK